MGGLEWATVDEELYAWFNDHARGEVVRSILNVRLTEVEQP
jgi:hypothetical protein